MRTLFWHINATLGGFEEVADPDFDRYASEMLQSIDTIILGRRTYELFAGYWPSAVGPDAERLNELPKIVFSRTLTHVDWSGARVADNVAETVGRLKREAGRDIAVFGSANLAGTLMELGLIDEYRIVVTPAGAPVSRLTDRIGLELVKARTWSSGTVALCYRAG